MGGVIYSDFCRQNQARFINDTIAIQRKNSHWFPQDGQWFSRVGSKADAHGGSIKGWAKMVKCMANSVVPQIQRSTSMEIVMERVNYVHVWKA